MRLLKNTPITISLLVLVLPAAICLAALAAIFVQQFETVLRDTEKSLYDELYIASSTIINADRDFYQAAIAEKELVLSWDAIHQEARDSLIADFDENAVQVKDRLVAALNSLRGNERLYREYTVSVNGKTMRELEESFFASYDKWLAAFDINANTGDLENRNSYFSSARDDINSMTELLDEYAVAEIERIEAEAGSTIQFTTYMVIAMLTFLTFISAITILYLRNNIRYITKISNSIADGQFNMEISAKRFGRGEVGQLCRATGNILGRLNNYVDYIREITEVLDDMAHGEMLISLTNDYAGEFAPVKEALLGISSSMCETLSNVSQSAHQVDAGAGQIAIASQRLAQGASEQSGTIDALSSSITDISRQVSDNTKNALTAKAYSAEAGDEVVRGNEHMNDMLSAMKAISASSAEISKIMRVIDDIAFQTNILALNAAVEAARAGAAGKGFAVVAEEVRNLAGKSAEAATQTATLIQESLKAAEDGQSTAASTAASLKLIEEKTVYARNLVESIAADSETQSKTLEQIKNSIIKIADVVQENAATAEESAAASEELNAQSTTLSDEISKFKIGRPALMP